MGINRNLFRLFRKRRDNYCHGLSSGTEIINEKEIERIKVISNLYPYEELPKFTNSRRKFCKIVILCWVCWTFANCASNTEVDRPELLSRSGKVLNIERPSSVEVFRLHVLAFRAILCQKRELKLIGVSLKFGEEHPCPLGCCPCLLDLENNLHRTIPCTGGGLGK